jgi:SMI1 / KNR4 family (SUKH-1)
MSKRAKIEQDFRTLLGIIEQQRPGYTARLGTGLSDEEIEERIKIHPIPEGLFAIYSCVKGGYFQGEDIYSADFISGFYLIDVNSINAEIKSWEKTYKTYLGDTLWQPDMIPLLMNDCGDYYCVRTLPNDQSVVHIIKGSPELWVICQSLEDFILIITECYKQNVYFLDEYGDLDCQWDLVEEIIAKFNPNYYSQNQLEPPSER